MSLHRADLICHGRLHRPGLRPGCYEPQIARDPEPATPKELLPIGGSAPIGGSPPQRPLAVRPAPIGGSAPPDECQPQRLRSERGRTQTAVLNDLALVMLASPAHPRSALVQPKTKRNADAAEQLAPMKEHPRLYDVSHPADLVFNQRLPRKRGSRQVPEGARRGKLLTKKPRALQRRFCLPPKGGPPWRGHAEQSIYTIRTRGGGRGTGGAEKAMEDTESEITQQHAFIPANKKRALSPISFYQSTAADALTRAKCLRG